MSNHELIEVTDNPDVSANDYVVARNIAEKLHSHYPGHAWGVTCEGKKGIATVRNMLLSPNWGFIIRLQEYFGDTEMHCVIKAGGEILERFRVNRGTANHERIEELPMLPNGMPMFDHEMAKTRVPSYIIKAVDRTRRLRR